MHVTSTPPIGTVPPILPVIVMAGDDVAEASTTKVIDNTLERWSRVKFTLSDVADAGRDHDRVFDSDGTNLMSKAAIRNKFARTFDP